MANHKDTRFLLGKELIEAKRGEVITSEIKLMERWKWGKSKTRTFLELLEKDGMIFKKSDRKKTTITLVNYGVFQDSQTENRPRADREQTTSRPRADTINNVNNDNNENKKEIKPLSDKTDDVPYSEIIDFLNVKAETKFKASTETTRKHIRARWNDGFKLDDFKTVIEKKCREWNGTTQSKYLRPETLFGTKFESYLNQREGVKPSETFKGRNHHGGVRASYSVDELDLLSL